VADNFTPKQVWEAILSLTVYAKLSGQTPDDAGHLFIPLDRLACKLDPQTCEATKFGKYTVSRRMQLALNHWEDNGMLTTFMMTGNYAIHYSMLEFIIGASAGEVDAYVDHLLEDLVWPPKQ
jgi:hypothetical protein